ncbi:MAG: isoprenyl transferase [Pseudomonadota bacterium]
MDRYLPDSNPAILDPERMPAHVAIIMDGNGRWAKMRGLTRISGHKRGVDSVREVVRTCRELRISVLTLYAFSQENWRRPKAEVSALMGLLSDYLARELDEMLSNGIALRAIGSVENLPRSVRALLFRTIEKTASNRDMILNLALSYSGREELARAVRKLADSVKEGCLKPEDIDQASISRALDTAGLPDPDLLIRTSGEYRLSNFLLWQTAYSEIYITDVLWPDFRKEHLLDALLHFQGRQRRFGLTGEQIQAGHQA